MRHFHLFQIALIELTEPIQPSDTIQPKELPQHCVNTDEAGICVTTAGIGQSGLDQYSHEMDGLLRQATFSTFARNEYGGLLYGRDEFHPPSLILAYSSISDSGAGDSGLFEWNTNTNEMAQPW